MCLYILALGSVLFALEKIISVGSFHALVTIHEPEQLTTWSLTGVSVPGRQNRPWEEQMSLNFGAISSFLKQRQNEELGKDNYKGKCQEIQDFVTNEVFRSSGTSVHKSSAFVCLSWIWQPGLLGSLKSDPTLGMENLKAFGCFFPFQIIFPSLFWCYLFSRLQELQNFSSKYNLTVNPWCHWAPLPSLDVNRSSTSSSFLQLNSSFLSSRIKNTDFCP